MKYTEEKALYFAAKPSALHVAPVEKLKRTTLWGIVSSAVTAGHMEKCGEDDSGEYFRATVDGQIRLLELQIQWRQRNGKDTTEQRDALRQLQLAN